MLWKKIFHLCVCVCYTAKASLEQRGSFVSLSSKQSCQSLWNTKLLIGPALRFPPGSETVISRPLLASQEQTRVPPAKLASLGLFTRAQTHTHLFFLVMVELGTIEKIRELLTFYRHAIDCWALAKINEKEMTTCEATRLPDASNMSGKQSASLRQHSQMQQSQLWGSSWCQ